MQVDRQSAQELQAALIKHNEDFLEIMEAQMRWALYPHLDVYMTGHDERKIYKLVGELSRPSELTDDFVKDLSRGDPFTYSFALLDLLRQYGRAVREAVAQMIRTLGDAYFAAASLPCPNDMLALAEQTWLRTSLSRGLHVVDSMCNTLPLLIRQKR